MKTSGLYIHFPFCVKKCNYCDFLSFPIKDCQNRNELFSSYIQCVKNEILYRRHLLKAAPIDTVFIGGGTPSLLSPENITRLMTFIDQVLDIDKNAEITMECNPGTLTMDKLSAMHAAKINRLSLGLQTAKNNELSCLGRIHTFEQFLDNYEKARAAGFDNINIDLMSALPGQSVKSYTETLDTVLRLQPEHISAYSLIIEEGTPFEKIYRNNTACPPLPSEDDERLMYHLTKQMLSKHGYDRYELSNYALTGFECRHNIGYWTRKDYLGIGLGSASLIGHTRFSNIRELKHYMNLWQSPKTAHITPFVPPEDDCFPGTEEIQHLDQKAEMEEFMFLGLRLTKGISPETFEQVFNCSLNNVYYDAIEKHLHNKTLIFEQGRLKLTDIGQDVANYVMSDFILD